MIRGSKFAENSWLFTKYKRDTKNPRVTRDNHYVLVTVNPYTCLYPHTRLTGRGLARVWILQPLPLPAATLGPNPRGLPYPCHSLHTYIYISTKTRSLMHVISSMESEKQTPLFLWKIALSGGWCHGKVTARDIGRIWKTSTLIQLIFILFLLILLNFELCKLSKIK